LAKAHPGGDILVRIRSAWDVLDVVYDRGLDVKIRPGTRTLLVLRPTEVDKSMVTTALIGALSAWRPEIIEILEKQSRDGGGVRSQLNPRPLASRIFWKSKGNP
jgi:hypothetical protein